MVAGVFPFFAFFLSTLPAAIAVWEDRIWARAGLLGGLTLGARLGGWGEMPGAVLRPGSIRDGWSGGWGGMPGAGRVLAAGAWGGNDSARGGDRAACSQWAGRLWGALAVHAGVTAGTLARLELGQSDPSWSTICAVAKALDVRLREIVTAVETQHQTKTKER